MKSSNIFVITLLLITFLTSCKKDNDVQFGVILENCDQDDCNDKSCATMLNIRDRVTCNLNGNNDVDWYAYTVDEADVNNNSGTYSFNFINDTDALNIKVELFAEGVAEGKIQTSGNGDGIYEAGLDLTGSITFLEEGTYYIKVSRDSGDIGGGLYQIRIN